MSASTGASVIDLYHQAQDYFFVSISQFYRRFGSGLSAYCTGVEASSLNLLMMNVCAVDEPGALAEGVAFLQRTGMPSVWWCPRRWCLGSAGNCTSSICWRQTRPPAWCSI